METLAEMKLSIVRTDEKGIHHLSVRTPEWLMEHIQTDTKNGLIARLREFMATFGSIENCGLKTKIAMVCPSVEMVKSENGSLEVVAFNGLINLQVANFVRQEDMEAVKESSKILPTTFAAFKGADGRSVEILVSVATKRAVSTATEAEMDLFCQKAYDVAFGIYNSVLPKAIEHQLIHSKSGFLMPLDNHPYYHPEATPLTVDDSPLTTKAVASEADLAAEQPSWLTTKPISRCRLASIISTSILKWFRTRKREPGSPWLPSTSACAHSLVPVLTWLVSTASDVCFITLRLFVANAPTQASPI